jgi:PAS domain S-box-containing protein
MRLLRSFLAAPRWKAFWGALLERDTVRRKQAEERLQETRRTLATLLSNLPGMAYRSRNDTGRTMQFVSEGCFELTGYYPDELLESTKISYMQLIHPDDRNSVWNKVQKAVQEDRPFQFIYRITTPKGQMKWVWEKGRGVFSPSGKLLALEGFITDMTERVQAYQMLEQRITDRTRELSALYEVTAVASKSLDLTATLESSLEQVLTVMGCGVGAIHLFDETNQVLRVAVWRGLSSAVISQLDWLRPGQGLVGSAMERGEPLVVPNVAADPRAPEAVLASGSQAYVGAPLRARGRVLGVLSVVGEAERQFEVEEVALLASIADEIGVAVENARLYEQIEQLAVMEERSRLARELHDSVTQSLYSLTLFAEVGRRAAEAGELEQVIDYLTRLGQVAQQTLKEMRLLVYELRTSALETEGLVRALQQRLEAVEKRAGVESRLVVEAITGLPALVEEGLYRIAQEALNNALKHAAATLVTVRININAEQAELEVIDNGMGFDPAVVGHAGGIGLNSMAERAEQLGGKLTIFSKPGEGTRVRVNVSTRRSWSKPLLPIDKIGEVSR